MPAMAAAARGKEKAVARLAIVMRQPGSVRLCWGGYWRRAGCLTLRIRRDQDFLQGGCIHRGSGHLLHYTAPVHSPSYTQPDCTELIPHPMQPHRRSLP